MEKITNKDLAIAIWEHHRERTPIPLEDFKGLQPYEQDVLLSAADFAMPGYKKRRTFNEAVRKVSKGFDPVDYGCDGCVFLKKIKGFINENS